MNESDLSDINVFISYFSLSKGATYTFVPLNYTDCKEMWNRMYEGITLPYMKWTPSALDCFSY